MLMRRLSITVVALVVALVATAVGATPALATTGTGISNPADLVFSGDGAMAFVAAGMTISVIETATDAVVRSVELPQKPLVIATRADDRVLYVITDYCDPTLGNQTRILSVDTATMVVAPTALIASCSARALAITADGSKAYLPAYDVLQVRDVASGQLLGSARQYQSGPIQRIALGPGDRHVYIRTLPADQQGISYSLDAATLGAVQSVSGPYGPQISDIVPLSDDTRAVLADQNGWLETGGESPLGGNLIDGVMYNAVSQVTATPDGNILLAAHGDTIDAVSITSGKRLASFLVAGWAGVWVSPGGDIAYGAGDTLTRFTLGLSTKPSAETDRIAGDSRYETAIALSKAKYPSGNPVVYVASGADFPDALSSGPAAAKVGASLLLTTPGTLMPDVAAEITRLHPSRIVAVGGPAVMSATVRAALSAAAPGAELDWVYGADRYSTSRAIAKYAWTSAPDVYVADGRSFADALGAASAAGARKAPLIVVPGNSITYVTKPSDQWDSSLFGQMVDMFGAMKVTRLYVVGGEATITPDTYNKLGMMVSSNIVYRLWGQDRFGTSLYATGNAIPTADHAYLASGYSFPDALAGAAVAGAEGAPLYTVPQNCVPKRTLVDLALQGVTHVTILGGTVTLASAVDALTPCP
ncbi:cell wall-binding repeat-containing protein [Microbacterium rhizosphaerae]|uniref:Cell wall-binding repeat-containing protein n=1 Tax=Microbacterium rhizosphaerae TaxID=1678237 RepID=A0ABZ0SRN8_9MICO|nr:cell wall-binding repeat-containing protein [Microbacterium rhizosphaerae]WPR90830.1 cell wall-binding repeat-containing protein [Microbacterium rhizosphaerae]